MQNHTVVVLHIFVIISSHFNYDNFINVCGHFESLLGHSEPSSILLHGFVISLILLWNAMSHIAIILSYTGLILEKYFWVS